MGEVYMGEYVMCEVYMGEYVMCEVCTWVSM